MVCVAVAGLVTSTCCAEDKLRSRTAYAALELFVTMAMKRSELYERAELVNKCSTFKVP